MTKFMCNNPAGVRRITWYHTIAVHMPNLSTFQDYHCHRNSLPSHRTRLALHHKAVVPAFGPEPSTYPKNTSLELLSFREIVNGDGETLFHC